MLVKWWRSRRRRQLLSTPVDPEWDGILQQNVPQYSQLAAASQRQLLNKARIFIAEKHWEGCGGQKMTDEIRVTIAGYVSLMLLGWEHEYLDRLQTVLVYPDSYVAPQRQPFSGNTVLESSSLRLGEAWQGGPVIISWAGVPRFDSPPVEGRNVVIHEFAHVIDMLDQQVDGTPPMSSAADYELWKSVRDEEFQRLQEEADWDEPRLLDDYAAESHVEFFAVVSEYFFEVPNELAIVHPRLYNVLCRIYRQDPANLASSQVD